ncbi:MAG: 4Fe-4S ferredoxin [Spirochaetes bacterium]|nr:MAG: 4Fe-4S ferredoxin [Spirochaetota bacterium]
MDKIIVVDIEKCMSCHSCELACSVAHSKSKDLLRAIQEGEQVEAKIILERFGDSTLPIQCKHCEDAPCITVCPAGAISRPSPNSPVILNHEKCIGCHACVIVCPFGVITFGPDGKSLTKCDLCYDRLKEGKIPACAEACITGAIRYLSIKELNEMKRREYFEKLKTAKEQADASLKKI